MKITVVDPLQLPQDVVLEKFRELKCQVEMYDSRPESEEELVRRCRDADIAVVVNTPMRAGVLEKLKNLKMIAVSFTGYDHIDVDKCRELGITVSNVPEYSTNSVAELVFGMVIAAARKIIECDRAVRIGRGNSGLLGTELFGKTIGVIGTGKIGQRVCEIALAFGMRVLAYSRTRKKELEDMGVEYVTLEELLSRSDIVTVHVPLSRETEGMIGRKEIFLMKNGAIIVNTARGKIIDTESLAEALESGKITACLDVFDIEPPLPGDHPLRDPPNTVLTPHIGYYTKEALERRLEITVENIRAFIEGKPKNVVT
mgnify:CR=1 FL=1